MLWGKIKLRLSLIWEGIRAFFLFIGRIPGFYRLNRFWDKPPRFYWDTLNNYVKVMYEFTDGHFSKPTYDAATVIDEVRACIDKNRAEEANGNNVE